MYFGTRYQKRPQLVTIYLMNVIGSDVYKIGYTTSKIDVRKYGVKSQVGPVKTISTTYCDFKHESILHKHFNSQKVSDGIYKKRKEYFHLSESDISFVLDYFKGVAVPELVMDNKHPKWKQFLRSITFQVDRVSRTCDHTHFHTRYYLHRYKQVNIEKSIALFKEYGGLCDCSLLRIAPNFNTPQTN